MSTMMSRDEEPGMVPGLRDAVRALTLGGCGASWQASDGEIVEGLAAIGQVRQLLDVAEVALAREGVERGLPAEGAWSAHDWLAGAAGERSPLPATGHVARVLRMARGGARTAEVRAAFEDGDLPLDKADRLVRFEALVRPVADPEMLEADLATLLAGARDDVVESGPQGRRRERRRGLSEKELAAAITRTGRMLRPERDLDDDDRRAKAGRSLVKSAGPAGMTSYRVTLDPEGAAVVDSALAALSAPVKGPDGEPDDRPASRRRADALVEIVRRGVSAPGEAPRSAKAQVHVTIPLESLLEGAHGAGVASTGEVLAPSVVRRMACDAGIIPVVLGGAGEILDMGRSVRLFTPGQRRAVWLRDGGCTYPGCTMPAQWCDAHHVAWWSRGGASDVGNAALLCGRHHTRVHDRDLTATVADTGVTWHL